MPMKLTEEIVEEGATTRTTSVVNVKMTVAMSDRCDRVNHGLELYVMT